MRSVRTVVYEIGLIKFLINPISKKPVMNGDNNDIRVNFDSHGLLLNLNC